MKALLFLLLALVGCVHRPITTPAVKPPQTVFFLLEGSRHSLTAPNIRTIHWAYNTTNLTQWISVNRPMHRRLPARSGLHAISDLTWLKILPVTIPTKKN